MRRLASTSLCSTSLGWKPARQPAEDGAALQVLPVCVQVGMLQISLGCSGDADCRHKQHMLSSQPAPLAALQDVAAMEASKAALHGAVTLESADWSVCRLLCVTLHWQCGWRLKRATSQQAASAVL